MVSSPCSKHNILDLCFILLITKFIITVTSAYRLCGLNVHKDSIFACVKKGKYCTTVREFCTNSEGLSELHHWLHGELVTKVAMKSTVIYWMPVWRALELDFDLLLVNPYFIKQMHIATNDL